MLNKLIKSLLCSNKRDFTVYISDIYSIHDYIVYCNVIIYFDMNKYNLIC